MLCFLLTQLPILLFAEMLLPYLKCAFLQEHVLSSKLVLFSKPVLFSKLRFFSKLAFFKTCFVFIKIYLNVCVNTLNIAQSNVKL